MNLMSRNEVLRFPAFNVCFCGHSLSTKAARFPYFFFDVKLFSLTEFILKILSDEQITNHEIVDVDTFSEETLCFSYRRNYKKNITDYGRMISTIVIKDR